MNYINYSFSGSDRKFPGLSMVAVGSAASPLFHGNILDLSFSVIFLFFFLSFSFVCFSLCDATAHGRQTVTLLAPIRL